MANQLLVQWSTLHKTRYQRQGQSQTLKDITVSSLYRLEYTIYLQAIKAIKKRTILRIRVTQGNTIQQNFSLRTSTNSSSKDSATVYVTKTKIRVPRKVIMYDKRVQNEAVATDNLTSIHSGKSMGAPPMPNRVDYNQSTELYKKHTENDFKAVSLNPLSTLSVDVDRASYSNVRRFINQGQMPPADAIRVEEMINYFDYQYPQPQSKDPIAIVTEITNCPWQPQHKLLHVGIQAKKIKTDNLPASNLVFLLDVSGSMSSTNKLPLVISAMKLLVNNLREKDKISIVVYAGSAGMVLPPTNGNNKTTIYEALDRLHAGGSTARGAGIKLAYNIAKENFIRGGNNRVILATDGDFNVGVRNENDLETLIVAQRDKGVFLTCLGFGNGNYKDSKMELLADKGNGNYAYIDNILEAQKTLVTEFGGTIFTVAKDVKAQIEFNPHLVQGYRLVGYENRLLNNEDFTNDKKDAGDMGSGHSVTIIYEIIPVGIHTSLIPDNSTHLKYQPKNNKNVPDVVHAQRNEELATIKFRYKKPHGSRSSEMIHIIKGRSIHIQNASANARFSTSIAMYGMILKNSAYKGSMTYNNVLSLAKNARGNDTEGYRSEFIRLVRTTRDLTDKVSYIKD